MPINLNQFRAFYLAAREGSVTKAAEILHVSQPAVTMQIKTLQRDIEVELFRKCGKNIELTDAGRAMFDYAQRLFEIVGEMEHVLKGYLELTHGSLTIGTTRSFARHLMPGLLSLFQERYPRIKVRLAEGNSQEIADGVANYEYDFGIIGRLPLMGKLRVVPYSLEEFCLVLPPKHRLAGRGEVSLMELRDEPLIIREVGSGSRHAILSMLESHRFQPSIVVEAGSNEFIKEYVIKGRGISFLYKPEVALEAKMGLLSTVTISEGPMFVQTDIVFPADAEPPRPARAFLGLIEKGSRPGPDE
ncbi:MAG: LysR family transcriptional regulator [Proteobacteria bacterium]|nr:LysR family transcriptional regulator [Pseudomonadota bacterium]MBU1742402.1 LysR family transcriptional regulator [Pseudomonadota bacterium]